MTIENQIGSPPAITAASLIDALNNMRDELVKTSQMVKEYQVFLDSVWRCSAAEIAKEAVVKSNNQCL